MSIRFTLIRLLVKSKRKWKRFYQKKILMDETQKKAVTLFNYALVDKNNKIVYSSISNKRYIENKEILIILSHIILTIITSSSCHEITLSSDSMGHLEEDFDKELERRVRSIEFKKRNNIISDLDKILLKYKEAKETK